MAAAVMGALVVFRWNVSLNTEGIMTKQALHFLLSRPKLTLYTLNTAGGFMIQVSFTMCALASKQSKIKLGQESAVTTALDLHLQVKGQKNNK